MERKSLRKAQGGFTLIEIIAVLVILGILAAVAIPRYLNLQTAATVRGAAGIAAAAQSALSMAYAEAVLASNDVSTISSVGICADEVSIEGDYLLSCAGTLDQDVDITVTHTSGIVIPDYIWPSPGTFAVGGT